MQLYMRAVGVKKGAEVAVGNPTAKDISKMTPAEKRKEIARRRAEAQKEKVRLARWASQGFSGVDVETCVRPCG